MPDKLIGKEEFDWALKTIDGTCPFTDAGEIGGDCLSSIEHCNNCITEQNNKER
jgi:hypothetical protein